MAAAGWSGQVAPTGHCRHQSAVLTVVFTLISSPFLELKHWSFIVSSVVSDTHIVRMRMVVS